MPIHIKNRQIWRLLFFYIYSCSRRNRGKFQEHQLFFFFSSFFSFLRFPLCAEVTGAGVAPDKLWTPSHTFLMSLELFTLHTNISWKRKLLIYCGVIESRLFSIREEMDCLVLEGSRACTGRRETKDFEASKGLKAPMDYRWGLRCIEKKKAFNWSFIGKVGR